MTESWKLGEQVRALYAKRDDPYVTVDVAIARVLSALSWIVGAAIIAILLPFAPPTEAIGWVGWPIAGAMLVACLLVARRRVSEKWEPDFVETLIGGCLAFLGLVALEWLAGGRGTPYHHLYVLPVLYAAAAQPRRFAVIFLVVAAIGIWAPLLYSDLDREETLEVATQLLLLVGLAIGARVLFTILRVQRAGLREARERAEQLARKDSLTALGNRRAFEEALEAAVARAERSESPVSVILGDLDNFKQLNDEHGHAAGDECLRRVAEVLEHTARTGDGCYRWGGDEFVVLLPETSGEEAEQVKERICAAAADACRVPGGEPIRLTCGSAEHERGQRASALIQAADDALRRSKQARRFESLDQA